MATEKQPFHVQVAERLIEQLRKGTAPWQRPWSPGQPSSFLPLNPTTGKRYRGINAVVLLSQGRSDQRWLTYKQAAAVGAQVRKGEKGTSIQYWKLFDERTKLDASGKAVHDSKGDPIKVQVRLEHARVFYATVFNAEQMDNLPAPEPRPEVTWSALERAEGILQASGAVIHHGAQGAFYRPSDDTVNLPDRAQFASADRYYATALHELGHWTGHPSRLDRDMAHPFGSEGYAKEELRAEISSLIVGNELGIGHDPEQHAAYVGSWIKALQDDPLEIFRAAADAEKIQEYLLAREHERAPVNSDQVDVDQRRSVAILLATEAGMTAPERLVDLSMSTAREEKDGDDITTDPVTGKSFNAGQLMNQLESEGKPRMGEDFSRRRGYSDEQIADHQEFMATYNTAVEAGADADSLQYALGVATGQLDIPPEMTLGQNTAAEPAKFGTNPAQLDAELTAAESAIFVLTNDGKELDAAARARTVQLIEHAMSVKSLVAEGSDPLVAALNKSLDPHQRTAMSAARSLAVHDGDENRNPFTHEQLSRAYESEFKHNLRMRQGQLDEWERGEVGRVNFELDPPSPAAIAEVRADRPAVATMQPLGDSESLARTFVASRDSDSRQAAAQRYPQLVAAFAYESALSRFAEERLSVGDRHQFMHHQRSRIAADIEAGIPLPVVRIKEKECTHAEAGAAESTHE